MGKSNYDAHYLKNMSLDITVTRVLYDKTITTYGLKKDEDYSQGFCFTFMMPFQLSPVETRNKVRKAIPKFWNVACLLSPSHGLSSVHSDLNTFYYIILTFETLHEIILNMNLFLWGCKNINKTLTERSCFHIKTYSNKKQTGYWPSFPKSSTPRAA